MQLDAPSLNLISVPPPDKGLSARSSKPEVRRDNSDPCASPLHSLNPSPVPLLTPDFHVPSVFICPSVSKRPSPFPLSLPYSPHGEQTANPDRHAAHRRLGLC